MKQQLKDSVKEAMKARDKVRVDTIRGLLSEIQYEEMQRSSDSLDSEGCLTVLKRELKKRREEIDFAQKANRSDLEEKLLQEISILESFQPSQMTGEHIERAFLEMRSANPALQMGAAMKLLKEKFAGQFDGKTASDIAKKVFG